MRERGEMVKQRGDHDGEGGHLGLCLSSWLDGGGRGARGERRQAESIP